MAFADAPPRPIFMLLDSTKVYDCVPPIFASPESLVFLFDCRSWELRPRCSFLRTPATRVLPHMSNVYMYIYVSSNLAAIGLFLFVSVLGECGCFVPADSTSIPQAATQGQFLSSALCWATNSIIIIHIVDQSSSNNNNNLDDGQV